MIDLRKITYAEVVELAGSKGIKPLFIESEYKDSKYRHTYETNEGYKIFVSVELLKKNKKFSIFHTFNPYTVENIKRYIQNKALKCKLLSSEYKSNNRHKLYFKCECGNEFKVTWNDFYTSGKTQCGECGVKKRSGKNHYDYNPNLTEEERIRRRMVTPGENMRVFRRKVFKKDNYTCVVCGNRSSKGNKVILHAHHLNGYHWYKQGRFDHNNGITLCESCHNSFHERYGKRNNTKEQFEEFKINPLEHA